MIGRSIVSILPSVRLSQSAMAFRKMGLASDEYEELDLEGQGEKNAKLPHLSSAPGMQHALFPHADLFIPVFISCHFYILSVVSNRTK